MERLTYKTNGKYMNTVVEQAPSYAIDCDIDTAITKLAEYEDLEEQGKLLKLPISTKTPIYSIEYCCGKNSNNKAGLCYKGRCEECERKSYHILEATAESSCKIFEIGKSVFLTKEAAEAALKELERGKGE